MVLSRLRTISQSYFREGFEPRGATQHVFKGSPTSFEEIGALIFTIHSYKYSIEKVGDYASFVELLDALRFILNRCACIKHNILRIPVLRNSVKMKNFF